MTGPLRSPPRRRTAALLGLMAPAALAAGLLVRAPFTRQTNAALIPSAAPAASDPQGAMPTKLRLAALRQRGHCADAEAEAKHGLTIDAQSHHLYQELAASMSARGAPRAEVEEVLRAGWSQLPPSALGEQRLQALSQLAAWDGDFQSALRHATELEHLVESRDHAEPHLRAVRLLADVFVETGRSVEAGRRADQILQRSLARDATDTHRLNGLIDEPQLLAFAYTDGRMTPIVWLEASEHWEHEATARYSAPERWALRWGSAVGLHFEAAEAFRLAPPLSGPDREPPSFEGTTTAGFFEAYEGRLFLHADDAARAAPLLEAAARVCNGFTSPFLGMRSQLWLGQAKEKLGDPAGACAAYAVVTERWGRAKPRSVTAEEAAQRAKALGCEGQAAPQ
jgi:eukaryotic-like serine/threonine-protein kinase